MNDQSIGQWRPLTRHLSKRTGRILLTGMLLLMTGLTFVVSTKGIHVHAANAGPALSVDATAASYPINPNIYGACGGNNIDANFAREISLPLCRWGGDGTTRYNWQANASNAGVDFWFLGGGSSTSTPGANADAFIDGNNAVGAQSMITIPMIPYIEKSNDKVCAFSIKKYGYDNVGGWGAFWFDWNGQGLNGVDGHYDCADGVYTSNSGKSGYFTGNDPADTSTPNSPDIQKAWVQHLVQRYGPSSQSHILYELDNEPSNWGYLHRDVYRPYPTSYDDLINYTEQYATAIKAADSTAQIVGPNDLGFAWQGNDGNMIKYLQAMQQYEQQHGQRILDIFSEHYPGATNGDIDHVRKLVDQYYPGTGIGFDEWNQGGDAVATASTLGQFARDRVSEAAYWTLGDSGEDAKPQAFAFRMYRNYDGNGSKFGDTYLQSTSADDKQLSVYGAKRSSDGAVTIMVTNQSDNDLSSQLSLNGVTPSGLAQIYTYSSANATAIVRQPDLAVNTSGFTTTYPAHSITLVVIPTGAGLLGNGTGLVGNYYNNVDLSGDPVATRTDNQVNFSWDGNTQPAPGVNGQNFSVRWTGQLQPTLSGNYTFTTVSDDGVRLWVNNQLLIDNWTYHGATTNTSGTIALTSGVKYDIRMEYFNGCCSGTAQLSWTPPGQGQQVIPQSQLYPAGSGLSGVYYNSTDLSGNPIAARTDAQINFTWDGNTAPAPGVNGQNFSVRWSGQVQATVSGNYTFTTVSDDGIRVWVNGQEVINDWSNHPPTTDTSASVFLIAGVKYGIKIEYYNGCCGATAQLQWTPPGQSQQVIPTSQLYPAGAGTGLTGAYYNSTDFSTLVVVTRIDSQIDFSWDGKTGPAAGVNPQGFGVIWSGEIQAPVSGNYQFVTVSDDGVRLWVNGQKLIDDWVGHGPTTDTSAAISLTAGQKYSITMDYYNGCCGGTASLQWIPPGGAQQVIPQGNLFPS